MFTKAFSPFLFILLILLLASCAPSEAQAPAPGQGEMINPGDRIGEIEITTAEAWDWDMNLYSLCIEGNAENEALHDDETVNYPEYPCDLDAGTGLLFSCMAVYIGSGESLDDLDEKFAKFEREMLFDGRLLNLPAFGSLDFSNGVATFRIGNVFLKNMTPGGHTLICRGDFEGTKEGNTYHFTVSEPSN
jgi:hypothetical protein